jgi:hypothetical protein
LVSPPSLLPLHAGATLSSAATPKTDLTPRLSMCAITARFVEREKRAASPRARGESKLGGFVQRRLHPLRVGRQLATVAKPRGDSIALRFTL